MPVAPRLTGVEVVDYLSACGQIFALSADGVRRVTSAGAWEKLALPGAEVVLTDTLGAGRLLFHDGLVVVFLAAAIMSLVAAVASALGGAHYVHEED